MNNSISKNFKVRKRRHRDTITARTPKKAVNSHQECDNEIIWQFQSPRRCETLKELLHGKRDGGHSSDAYFTQEDILRSFSALPEDSQDKARNRTGGNQWIGFVRNSASCRRDTFTEMYNLLNDVKQKNDTLRRLSASSDGFSRSDISTPGCDSSRIELMPPTPKKSLTRCDCTPTGNRPPSTTFWSDDENETFLDRYMQTVDIVKLTQSSTPNSSQKGKCTEEEIRRKRELAVEKRTAKMKADIERKRLAAIELRKMRMKR